MEEGVNSSMNDWKDLSNVTLNDSKDHKFQGKGIIITVMCFSVTALTCLILNAIKKIILLACNTQLYSKSCMT